MVLAEDRIVRVLRRGRAVGGFADVDGKRASEALERRAVRCGAEGVSPLHAAIIGSWTRSRSRLAAGIAFLLIGCTHIGPATVVRDRFDFGTAVAESWKQQTLLSIVKLRYLDVPVFLDVGQIVSSYELETGIDVSGQIAPVNRGDTFAGVGGRRVFTDRPTITYTPMTGATFLRGLISPIPTASILHTLQSGYAADFILGWTVESLNGLRNRSTAPGLSHEADPAFARALELMREIQMAGGINLGVEMDKDRGDVTVAVFRREDLSPSVSNKSTELRRLLGLPTEQQRFLVVTSPGRGANGELAIQPRSLLQVMQAAGMFVEVPPEHLARQWATPGVERPAEGDSAFRVRIRHSREKPANPYATVRYKDHWFWIDQSDWRSKRALGLVILLFTLIDTGGGERLPVLTIPTN